MPAKVASADREPGRIGYLVNAYPVVSETFLVHELRALEEAGVALALFPLDRRRDRVRHAATERLSAPRLAPPRALPFGWAVHLASHLGSAARAPGPYGRMLRDDLLKPLLRGLRAGGDFKAARRRRRLFALAPWIARRARRAGVVHLHAHYAKDPLEMAARVRWLTGIPYSFAAHAKDLYTSPPRRLARRLAKARFAVTCHRHGEKTLRRIARPADAGKVIRVPHGLDTGLFSPGEPATEEDLILAVGRLTPKKGFDTLVAACARLRRSGRSFRCVLVGEGRLRGALERAVERAGLEDAIELRPFVPQERLADLYRRAAMVVLPARVTAEGNRDGIPNVLLEALACGTPVVSTPVGAIAERVGHEVNGLLVPPDDAEALAAAMERLLSDAELRRRLAAAAAPSVAGMDFHRLARPLASRFCRLARRERGPRRPGITIRHRPEMIARASRLFGRAPGLDPDDEAVIARSMLGGLKANAWRPDLERLIDRRLWDEVFKSRRLRQLRRLLRRLGKPPDTTARILDLGCGRGGLSVAMSAGGLRPVAMDLRYRNCRTTRLRGRRWDLDLPACTGRAEALPFADRSFDVICLLEVLEHVGDPEALLAEARRVCRPDGVCVVTVINRWAHFDPHYRIWGVNFLPRRLASAYIALRGRTKSSGRDNQRLEDMHYYSFRAFRRLAASLGFELHDPETPDGHAASLRHRLVRWLSLGFNTATVVLARPSGRSPSAAP